MTWPNPRGKFFASTRKADKPTLDGYVFDSEPEKKRYVELRCLEAAGKITDLEVHPKPPYRFVVNGVSIGTYTCDFRYREDGALVIEDCKSLRVDRKGRKHGTAATREWSRTKKLMKACFGITVREIT